MGSVEAKGMLRMRGPSAFQEFVAIFHPSHKLVVEQQQKDSERRAQDSTADDDGEVQPDA
jgi:hypothetical protein